MKAIRWILAVIVIAGVVAAARGDWRSAVRLNQSSQTTPNRSAAASGGLHGVFIEPQDGVGPITDEIEAARISVDIEVYLLSSDEIVASLQRAKGRGAAVRIIIERQPYKSQQDKSSTKSFLEAKGFAVRFGSANP